VRYAILADIHANLSALEAVLADIEKRGGVSEIWCLGDIVGYGPDPHECIERLRQYEHVSVAGNHDFASIGKIDTSNFNPDAAAACQWTGKRLSQGDIDYLGKLNLRLEKGDFTLAHGSPRDPLYEYLLSQNTARENLKHLKTPFCLVGHSHTPFIVEFGDASKISFRPFGAGDRVKLEGRLIINPGSVGQPRDGDPRASYAVYDSDSATVENLRVPYDIESTQKKMAEAGLPEMLIRRLSFGR